MVSAPEIIDNVLDLILADRRIAETLEISMECVGFYNSCAIMYGRAVRRLNVDHK